MKALATLFLAALPLLPQTPPAKAPVKAAPKSPAPTTSPRLLNPSLFHATAPELYRAKLVTTKGDVVIEVKRANAPLGADRFYNLVRAGFFTNVSFYRMIAGTLVQFGISPSPAVTQAWSTAPIHDDPVKLTNKSGAVTFATSGPNRRTTQIFINIADMIQLDSQGFAPIGAVTEGMDVVKSFYSDYGEMGGEMGGKGPDQGKLSQQGKPYLDKNFPNLDSIKSASIIFPEPAAAPAAPAKKAAAPVKK